MSSFDVSDVSCKCPGGNTRRQLNGGRIGGALSVPQVHASGKIRAAHGGTGEYIYPFVCDMPDT